MKSSDALKNISRYEARLRIVSVGLRKKYENVLIMKYVDDLSSQEIADKLSIEEGSARNLVCKARKQFDKYVKNYKKT